MENEQLVRYILLCMNEIKRSHYQLLHIVCNHNKFEFHRVSMLNLQKWKTLQLIGFYTRLFILWSFWYPCFILAMWALDSNSIDVLITSSCLIFALSFNYWFLLVGICEKNIWFRRFNSSVQLFVGKIRKLTYMILKIFEANSMVSKHCFW